MRQKVITQNDKPLMNSDGGKIGIEFLVTTEPKFNLSPNKKKNKNDQFDVDDVDLSFLIQNGNSEKTDIDPFESSFKINDVPFKTYKSHAGLLICHYFDFNGYRIMRELLVKNHYVDKKFLGSFSSTNGNNNFIPLEVRKLLSTTEISKLQKLVIAEVYQQVSQLEPKLLHLLKSHFKAHMFEPMPYFKLSNLEVTLDVESAPGIDFGSREEIHQRLLPNMVTSLSGVYCDQKANSISPLASTALAQCDQFPPYFRGVLKDKTHVNIYSKYCSKSKNVGWLQRFERKFSYEPNMTGADKIKYVLNKGVKKGCRVKDPTFSSAKELQDIMQILFDDTFDLWLSHLNVSINRNSDEFRNYIGSVLQKYCRQNSLELYRRLCYAPWTLPASMIDRPNGFPRKSIKALEKEGIIKKKNKGFYELDLKYFNGLPLKK